MKIKATMSLPVVGRKMAFWDRNSGLELGIAGLSCGLHPLIFDDDRGLEPADDEDPVIPNGGGGMR